MESSENGRPVTVPSNLTELEMVRREEWQKIPKNPGMQSLLCHTQTDLML